MTRDKSGKLKDTGVRFSDIAGAYKGWLANDKYVHGGRVPAKTLVFALVRALQRHHECMQRLAVEDLKDV
jgi:hypothetical protein